MTDQPDPRVEAVANWLLTRHYTPEGAKELAPQCIAAIDALPRPELGEIGVTEEMIDRACKAYGLMVASNERARYRNHMSLAIGAALSALDPRHRAVEPVVEDELRSEILSKLKAMETAETIMRDQYRRAGHLSDDLYKLHGDRAQALRDAVRIVETMDISAADRTRARTHITWRQPSEFTRTPNDEDARWVIIDQRYVSVLTAHLSRSPLPVGTIAWAEMPERAGWAVEERGSVAGESSSSDEKRRPRNIVVHQTVPIQVWADIDAGIADFVRHLNTIPGVRTHSCCQGTLGEGGAEPYAAYVGVSWWNEDARDALAVYGLKVEGECHGTVYPAEATDERAVKGQQTAAYIPDVPAQTRWQGKPFSETVAERRAADPAFAAALDEEIASETPGAAVPAGGETKKPFGWRTMSGEWATVGDKAHTAEARLFFPHPPLADTPEAPGVVWAETDGERAPVDRVERQPFKFNDEDTASQGSTFQAIGPEPQYAHTTHEAPLSLDTERLREASEAAPINMLLWCPNCHHQHVDAPDADWTNPPHRSHLCHACGTVWRPADVETNGVVWIETRGSKDTWVPSSTTHETPGAAVLAGDR